MLLSAHPTQDLGLRNWARCYVHTFRSPRFDPEFAEPDGIAPGASETVSIGCGNESAFYRQALDHDPADYVGTHDPVLYGEFVGQLLRRVRLRVVHHPTPAVSPLLQICVVNRLFVRVIPANAKRYGRGGEVTDYNVPKLATTLDDLHVALEGLGGAANARC
jgi:hypothetical protein